MKRILLLTTLFFLAISCLIAQRTVSGKVTDDKGEGLPGVNVVIKGTTTGVTTDIDGNYSIAVNEGDVLVFSYVGFESQEVEVGSRTVLDIAMSGVTELQEVVVQAYGITSERLKVSQIETVGSESFENFPIVSAQEALQGQASGVQVSGGSGVIGAPQNIRIRGVASITSGTQPLYVIDGVPLNDASGGTEGYSDAAGGAALNPLLDLNPNDIETFTVLKDASAAALYGSRGANGVVLITTKKGATNQKTVFSADWFTGWSEPTTTRDVLSADEFRQFRSDVLTATGTPTSPGDLQQGGFNWANAVLETGRTDSYSLSARGGNETTAFYVSGTYLDASSYQIGNDLRRLNGRLNLSHEASDFVSFGVNLSYANSKTDRFSQENSTGSPLTVGLLQVPWLEPFDEDGNFQDVGFDNPLASQALNTFSFTSKRLTANAYVEFRPIEGLTLKTDWGTDLINTDTETRTVELFFAGGSASREVIEDSKWLTTNTASYNAVIDKHTFTPLVGFSFEESNRFDVEVGSQDFLSDDLPNVISGATPTTTESTGTAWALFSTFARVNYAYDNKYLFQANIRRDGSSRFGSNFRYGTFWAVSGGWIFTDESFIPKNNILTFGKITASYGITGNDRIGNFASLGLFGAGRDYNGSPGLEPVQPANNDLTWEETAQLDISFNGRFLKDKINLDVSYYEKTTTDLLLSVPLPQTTGFPSRIENAGELVNKGVDLTLSSDIVQTNDFRFNVSLNLSWLNNEVTELPEGSSVDAFGNKFVGQASFSTQRAVEGQSVGEFFLNRYSGVNTETGDAQWIGFSTEGTDSLVNVIRADDRVYVGSGIPDFSGGITLKFEYKNFSLSAFGNFVTGNKLYIADLEFNRNAAAGGFNKSREVLNYWTQPGDVAFVPALSSSTFATWDNESTLHLIDGDYFRLKNVTLAYNLPRALLSQTGFLTAARVYVQGQNLVTFSDTLDVGIDPESSNGGTGANNAQGETFFTSPQARTVTAGVSLKF